MVTARRSVLLGLAALVSLPQRVLASDIIDLDWKDLVPVGSPETSPTVRGVVLHESADLISQQPVSNGIRTEWNGKVVRIPGFVVPLDFSDDGVTSAILVPYVGACVHVPPPPANQLVLVEAKQPFNVSSMFMPVNVTGILRATTITTDLAEVGYALDASDVRPYGA